MKRIFIATMLSAVAALPVSAASLSQPTPKAPEWQPPTLETVPPTWLGKRPTSDGDSDVAMEKRHRQLELLQKQAQKARAREAKLRKLQILPPTQS
ncbi:hypothetical protein ACNKU7_10510 [Microbulbifer sp. SA54]|uniref:hypothetical protein n=1 Tax=Microbulbifer sp. SA54 TaxID=3401577 RepID=UPI003AAA5260